MNIHQANIVEFQQKNDWRKGEERRKKEGSQQIKEQNCAKCSHSFVDYSNNIICAIKVTEESWAYFKPGKTAICNIFQDTKALPVT